MRIKKRHIILFFTLFIVLGIGLVLYLNTFFLPIKLKEILILRCREQLGRQVSIGEVQYNMFKGGSISRVVIYQKSDPKKTFLEIPRIDFQVLLPPLLRNQQIIVPNLHIQQPALNLSKEPNGKWEFQDILSNRPQTAEKKGPFTFLLTSMVINKAKISVIDQTKTPAVTDVFNKTDIRVQLSVKKGVTFQLTTVPPGEATFKAEGHYDLATHAVQATVDTSKVDLVKYLNLFYQNPDLELSTGTLETAHLDITFKDKAVTIKGDAQVPMLDMKFKKDTTLKGAFHLTDAVITRTPNSIDIQGALTSESAQIFWGQEQERQFLVGDLTAKVENLTLREHGFELKATADLKGGNINLGKERIIQGHVLSNGISVTRQGGRTTAEGHLAVSESAIFWGPYQKITGNIEVSGLKFSSDKEDMDLQGTITGTGAALQLGNQISLRGDIAGEPLSYSQRGQDLKLLASGLSINNATFIWGDGKTASGDAAITNVAVNKLAHITQTDARITLTKGTVSWAQGQELSGDPVLDLNVTQDASQVNGLGYNGTITLKDASVKGLPQVGPVDGITGTVAFSTDKASFQDLNILAYGTGLVLNGNVNNFRFPYADVRLKGNDVDLTKAYELFKDKLKGFKITPSGKADIEATYVGSLSSPDKAAVTVAATVTDGSVSGADWPDPITGLSGDISYDSQKAAVAWQRIRASFQGKTYLADGRMTEFASPEITTRFSCQDFDLNMDLRLLGKTLRLQSVKGTAYGGDVDVNGEIFLKEDSSPLLVLRGKISARLEELDQVPGMKGKLSALKAQGPVSANFELKGKSDEWQKAYLNATLTGPKVSLHGFSLDKAALKVVHGKGPGTTLDLTASFYNGTLTASSVIDINTDDLTMTGKADLQNTDLALLKNDIKGKVQDLSGNLSASLSMEGPLASAEKLRGSGAVSVSGGNIFRFSLMKGIWKALLIPEFENIAFNQGRANFQLANKRFATKDLRLTSDTVELYAAGWIDLDQNISMNVAPQFKELTVIQSESIKKAPTALLVQAGQYVTIKVTGTLQKPQYSVKTQPGKILQNATGGLFDGVQSILEDILE